MAPSLAVLERLLGAAGLYLAVVDHDGRVIQPIAAGERDQPVDEAGVDVAVHVNALDRAAGLTAVEERAVGQILDRVLEIGIRPHICGVLPPSSSPTSRSGALPPPARCPPATEPVKPTKSTSLLAMIRGRVMAEV
jgi:hypothetical protein